MPPNKRGCERNISWWWVIWLFVLMVAMMNIEVPRTVITVWGYGISVDVIMAFLLGLIPFALSYLKNRTHYPQRLFKTQFDPNRNYEKEQYDKPLSLRFHKSREVYGFHFFVESKKFVDDIERIGIRPQVGLPWYKSWFANYNSKTRDIDLDERDNPPIRIKSVKDVSAKITQNFKGISDDGACGKWLHYEPSIKMKPNSKLTCWVEIEILKPWKGYIDFRLDTSDGRRVAHHPVELIRIARD